MVPSGSTANSPDSEGQAGRGLNLEHRAGPAGQAYTAGRVEAVQAQIICAELANIAEEITTELESRIVAYAEMADPAP
ncbi:hypothetical protein [Nocardia stercoris]|uniref:Uncharacterized protein n=1 Tax=Nocardia stercoris TaxID=2483361 RepID=A0A3M2KSP3_9NOCA|nr:hypothetical protein [Nocardia stercoris]RMI28682.1 hypothetical protein EBN03_28980 [Nocardia stercoris]